jgi:hypothetical protein
VPTKDRFGTQLFCAPLALQVLFHHCHAHPPQLSGNAALVERKAVTLALDHAFGIELADVGPAAIEM